MTATCEGCGIAPCEDGRCACLKLVRPLLCRCSLHRWVRGDDQPPPWPRRHFYCGRAACGMIRANVGWRSRLPILYPTGGAK